MPLDVPGGGFRATEADDILPLLKEQANIYSENETLASRINRLNQGPALRLLGIGRCRFDNLYKRHGPAPKEFGEVLVAHIVDGFHPEGEQRVLRAALSKVVEDELAKSGSAVEKTTQQNIDDCDTLIQFAKDNQGPTWDFDGKFGSKDGMSFFKNKLKEYPSVAKVKQTKIKFGKKNAPPQYLRKKKQEGEDEEIFGWAGGFILWIEGKKAELKKQLTGSGKAKADRKALRMQTLEIYKAVHKAVEDHERPKIRKALQDDAARGAVRKMVDLVTQHQSEIYKRLYPRAEARAAYNKEHSERASLERVKNGKWKKSLFKARRAMRKNRWSDIGKYLESRYAPKNNYPDYERARFENCNYEGGDLLQEFVGI